MERKVSRRTIVAGAAVLPVIGLSSALARRQGESDTMESTPSSSPEASPGASPAASPAASKDSITIDAEDIFFSVKEFKIPAGKDFEITLVNKGVLEHDLRIDELDFQIGNPLKPGEKDTQKINVKDKGKYQYYCTVPGHKEAGMVGEMTVE